MTAESIIERIRKLRKLATSPNVHEAAAAAKIADKLIQEHRLEEASIEGETDTRETPIEDGEPVRLGNKNVEAWRWYLYTRIAAHYDLACFSSWRAGVRTLHLVGRKGDIELAKFQMAFFVTEIQRLAMIHAAGAGRSGFNSFRIGAVSGILTALRDAKEEATKGHASTAMVLADRCKEANEFMNAKYPKMRTIAEPSVSVSDAYLYQKGQQAGRNVGTPKKGVLGQ